ncbi:kinase-like protein [Ascodesmis nigricans]|uniref:Kinase-like protein n=1 Tax=Ascodesmis nigricans TaxID=341454 RepID=A0A4S2N3B2_9PEZI|nr:kinase-like protein [Ascodesmis nigricans]
MVAYSSPHRHQGETAAIYTRQPSKSPSSRHLLHTPTQSCSSFPFSLTPSITTRSASRRSSPTKSQTGSPVQASCSIKFPLSLTTTSELNSGRMSLRSGSTSPRTSSPRQSPSEKLTPKTTRSGRLGASPRTSPLKRSETTMSSDQISRGSPVAKRRSKVYAAGGSPGYSDSSDSSASSSSSQGKTRSKTRRSGNIKKSSAHVFEKPSIFRNRPNARQQLDFGTPATDPTGRLRRITSVENFFGADRESPFNVRHAPLPSASSHPHFPSLHGTRPHPLSNATSHTAHDSFSLDVETPQNYKFAKPNPMAFHSTGFVPKRGRLSGGAQEQGPQPDTPCKKSHLFPGSAFQSKVGDRPPVSNVFGSPHTPEPGNNTNAPPSGLLDFRIRGPALNTSIDWELPPTPTKQPFSDDGSIFTANKRPRTDGMEFTAVKRHCANRIPATDVSSSLLSLLNSPQTPAPQESPVPDPSPLPISGKSFGPPGDKRHSLSTYPVTPAKDALPFRALDTPVFRSAFQRGAGKFVSNFHTIKHIGSGEFSDVYQVVEKRGMSAVFDSPLSSQQSLTPASSFVAFSSPQAPHDITPKLYAIKKSKSTFLGPFNKERQMEEARILQALKGRSHVVEYIDSWVENDRLFIQTEFCDNGSLDSFLDRQGNKGRLDEFRVWKIALEVTMGLRAIHDCGFMHLDVKPANVLISADGSLKISDFGMAASASASPEELAELEREGDREYIAPEVLHSRMYGRPVDIFALGLTLIEAATNQALPPNGPEWQKLREGDISVAPPLSTTGAGEFVHRDEDGNALGTEILGPNSEAFFDEQITVVEDGRKFEARRGDVLHVPREHDLIFAPEFMRKKGLEKLVSSMIAADPAERPTAADILQLSNLRWVATRRNAPATIFEGVWGPSDEAVNHRRMEAMRDAMQGSSPITSSPRRSFGPNSSDWDMDL